jgi:putative addiction module killer protein
MVHVLQTDVFSKWLSRLRDARAKARIVARVDAVRRGHFGDVKQLGGGVAEMRIDVGAGYRVYFVRRQSAVIILLCGGDKATQDKDIARAHKMATELG